MSRSCTCAACRVACETMPGILAVGDPEHLPVADLCASEGTVVCQGYHRIQVRTIVPRQQPDGRCVFLSDAGLCTVHERKPSGCASFDACGGSPADMSRAARLYNGLIADAEADGPYVRLWRQLVDAGQAAAPVADRKTRYETAIRLAERRKRKRPKTRKGG